MLLLDYTQAKSRFCTADQCIKYRLSPALMFFTFKNIGLYLHEPTVQIVEYKSECWFQMQHIEAITQ